MIQQSHAVGLVVMSEEDQGEPLLVHKISPLPDFYSRQEDDTIISWPDAELGADIALSFQEGVGCSFIWEQIKSVQRAYLHGDPNEMSVEGGLHVVDMDIGTNVRTFQFGGVPDQLMEGGHQPGHMGFVDEELPPPEMNRLPDLLKLMNESSVFLRERLPTKILKTKDYLPKLFELFRQCEDLDDIEGLHMLYDVFRGFVMLNDAFLYEALMSEEYVFDFVGVLEYEPDQIERVNHREFLREKVVFKEVVPISNASIRDKIHQTCRLGYLKDVILPRALDDAAFSMLTSMMMVNNIEVIQALHQDPDFFAELFRRLNASKPGNADWNDLVGFLQELCTLARHLQNNHRLAVFQSLQGHGLFDAVTDILTHGDEYSQLKAADVIMSSLHNDPAVIRNFMIQQQEKSSTNMLSEIVRLFLVGSDGIQATYLEILLFLMDPETMEGTAPDKDKFLDIFYEKHMTPVIDRIKLGRFDVAGDDQGTDVVPPWALTKMIDLLIYCVQNHQYRIKYYVLRNHIVQHVLHLTERKEKYVVTAGIRFLRACVGLKDDFYNRYLIKSNAFAPVMKVFADNGDKYNLLNSAILDLVDFIRRENIRALIHHLVDEYESGFEKVYYVDTFRLLKLRYQQSVNAPKIELPHGVTLSAMAHSGRELATAQALSEQRLRRDGSMSKDEEDYFESDDEPKHEVTSEAAHLPTMHTPPVLHFQGSRFVPPPMANSVFTDEVDTGPTHGELGKRARSLSPPPHPDSGTENGESMKKSKANDVVGENLTAAQRNAFKSQIKTVEPVETEEKHVEEENVKQTTNPTSSWVTVNEPSNTEEN